jgi:hypothetical protein
MDDTLLNVLSGIQISIRNKRENLISNISFIFVLAFEHIQQLWDGTHPCYVTLLYL